MSLFPRGGVNADGAFNTLQNPNVVDGCTPRWHAPRCVPKFDPAAANAVISEIINAVNVRCYPYDCNKLSNLADAISQHLVTGRKALTFDEPGTPVEVLNGNNRRLGGGSFTIPNTSKCDVYCMVAFESTIQFEQTSGGAGSQLDLDIDVNNAADFSGAVLANLALRVRSFDVAGGTAQFASNPTTYRSGVLVPPGGREFFWRARSTTSGGGNWQLQYTDEALQVTVFGTHAQTRDIFS